MDDVRMFDDCARCESGSRDGFDLRAFGIEARLAELGSGLRLRDDLARVVEAEIIPRLMLTHRPVAVAATCNILPDSEQVVAFANLMLSPAGDDLDARVDGILASGLAPDSLLLDLLAPTARHLGTLWEEDLCDFVEVTRAMGHLQRLLREINRRVEAAPPDPRAGRRILLAPCPGEAHRFGVTIVERFFRDAGWEVTCTAADPEDDVLTRVREGWFDVVGLSLACEVLLPRLAEAIAAIRRHSHNPAIRVIVGGPAFATDPAVADRVGADAGTGDGRRALDIAESLLDLPARPC